jgi:hypothetical protein
MLEKDQNKFILSALEATDMLKPFFMWSFLLKQQVNTMKMQFHYQLKDYDKVDELLPHCIYMDPMAVCMKMVRMYKNDDPKLGEFFKKKVKKFKAGKGRLIYSLYAWILVKRQDIDAAYTVLTEAKEKTEDDIVIKNWEHIANKRIKSFSNAGLGDEWYALGLEQPKQQMVRPKRRMAGARPF